MLQCCGRKLSIAARQCSLSVAPRPRRSLLAYLLACLLVPPCPAYNFPDPRHARRIRWAWANDSSASQARLRTQISTSLSHAPYRNIPMSPGKQSPLQNPGITSLILTLAFPSHRHPSSPSWYRLLLGTWPPSTHLAHHHHELRDPSRLSQPLGLGSIGVSTGSGSGIASFLLERSSGTYRGRREIFPLRCIGPGRVSGWCGYGGIVLGLEGVGMWVGWLEDVSA